jgi:hypothetical protein
LLGGIPLDAAAATARICTAGEIHVLTVAERVITAVYWLLMAVSAWTPLRRPWSRSRGCMPPIAVCGGNHAPIPT